MLPNTSAQPPQSVDLSEALRYWFKLGLISFGGPAGQIAMMHAELVERRRWISEKRFLHALHFCMVLPGPEAQQLATYIGWLMHGRLGGLIAGGLFVLPSLFILIALSWIYMAFGTLPAVAGIFWGIKPAVVAIVLAAAWRIGSRTLRTRWSVAIAAASLIAVGGFDVPFPALLLVAALVGALLGRVRPAALSAAGHGTQAKADFGPALIDDNLPPPAMRRHATLWVALAGCGLCAALILLLMLLFGREHPVIQMAVFFTKAALLTFGGAYAVLPYLVQHAVDQYHWLSTAQMLDGLALGETTPGPLIMIVAFIGFVGGWTQAWFGPGHLALAGAMAAAVATVFTFLPSFVFIFAGAPLIESARGNLRLQAPMTAISAAVVGVIVNLTLYFGAHVFFPKAALLLADWSAIGIFAGAAIALLRFRIGMVPVIAACGGIGLAVSFLS